MKIYLENLVILLISLIISLSILYIFIAIGSVLTDGPFWGSFWTSLTICGTIVCIIGSIAGIYDSEIDCDTTINNSHIYYVESGPCKENWLD